MAKKALFTFQKQDKWGTTGDAGNRAETRAERGISGAVDGVK